MFPINDCLLMDFLCFADSRNILGVHVYPESGGQDLSVHVQQEDASERVRLIEGLHAYKHTPTTLTHRY